jgi:dolichyl-phosphate beta-glucosyltransferase
VIKRNRPWKRRLLSRAFHTAAVLIAGLPSRISDSQCGFKVYRGDVARRLFSECVSSGYLYEIEILLQAFRRRLRIEEFPVEWRCDLDTRLRPGSDAPGVIKELIRMRRVFRRTKTGAIRK